MSPQDRKMVYFAIATLYLYRCSIAAVRGPQTVPEFIARNELVIKRVRDEAISLFGYELSQEQIGRAIFAYLAPGQRVENTAVATVA